MPAIRYTPSLETIEPDEQELFEQIADTFRAEAETVKDQQGHAVRASHAKATAFLKGELVVADGLARELAQGLFANAGRYPIIARFAQGPGELLPDSISTHRGLAIKILGLDGERILESDEQASQDFVLENGKAFINSNATRFFANLKGGVSKAPHLPEGVKQAVSSVSHATGEALKAVGLESKTIDFFGHAPLHPLAETYFSQVPMRWGDYVAKVGAFPVGLSDAMQAEIETSDDPNAFRNVMTQHFASNGAVFELRAQLCTDLDAMPIEDASVEWPEEQSAYRTVGRIEFPAQASYSEQRRAFFDEQLGFRPANSLAAHRPLGQIMRARLAVYRQLAALRQAANGVTYTEPMSLDAVP